MAASYCVLPSSFRTRLDRGGRVKQTITLPSLSSTVKQTHGDTSFSVIQDQCLYVC